MPYYLRFRGKVFGPFDEEQLKEMKTKRNINKNSDISENKIDWFPAYNLEFLFAPPSSASSVASSSASSDRSYEPTQQLEWFYSIDGIEGFGPVTRTIIVQLIQTGTLHAHSFVWQEGQNAVPICSVKPFDEFFHTVSPPLSQKMRSRSTNFKFWDELPTSIKRVVSLCAIAVVVIIVGNIVFAVINNLNLATLKDSLFQSINYVISLGDPKSSETLENAISKAESSVAVIKGIKGHGTGFLIKSGILVTNKHVIDDQILELSTVYFPSSDKENRKTYKPTLLYKDSELDLAFLKIETDLPALPIVENHKFRRGEEVVAIGNSGVGKNVMEVAVNKGILSSETSINNHIFYQLGISVNAGNSGGPAINQTGQAIGIITLKASSEKGIEGIAFCIRGDDILKSLEAMEKLAENNKKINSSLHRARVTLKWIAEVDLLYRSYMNKYVIALYEANQQGIEIRDSLNKVREETKKDIDKIQYFFSIETEKEINNVTNDTNLSENTRRKIKSYYETCKEEKKFIDNPLVKVRNKETAEIIKHKRELEEKCESLLTPLLKEFGILRSEIDN